MELADSTYAFLKELGDFSHVPSLTAADYFEYCRIAYRAGKRRGETIPNSLSGGDLYEGESISRLAETIRMFLAIHKTGRPISIADPEGVRRRLLGQDNIGIVPSYASLHRANQHFLREQRVFDVMHYDDLGRFKRRLTPFITWEPLAILKPLEKESRQ